LEEQLVAIIARAKPHAGRLRALCGTIEVEVSCVVYSETRPVLNLPPSVVGAIADMGASIDFDVYFTGD
jgi:hypothetical protein